MSNTQNSRLARYAARLGGVLGPALLLVCVWVAFSASARAQETSAPLTVGWAEIVPLFRADADGTAGGFGADLMREVARIAGLEIIFRKFNTAEAMIRAQAMGEIDLLPGVASLPLMESQNVFSAPVAETSIRVFVRSEEHELHDPETMSGLRVAIPSV
ncbi:MAG: transporter substrate-binding domain-containing protein, partial [Pseudomonadota bacterium]